MHVLLSYFVVESPAQKILADLQIDEKRILAGLTQLGHEPESVLDLVASRALKVVGVKGIEQLDPILYLSVLVSSPETLVLKLLDHCQIDPNEIVAACNRAHSHNGVAIQEFEARETGAFGSLEALQENAYAVARQNTVTRGKTFQTPSDDQERRSHSPDAGDQIDWIVLAVEEIESQISRQRKMNLA